MAGIFYDEHCRRVALVQGAPEPGWTLVTHNLHASVNQCRRIMREWLAPEVLASVDWSALDPHRDLRRSA